MLNLLRLACSLDLVLHNLATQDMCQDRVLHNLATVDKHQPWHNISAVRTGPGCWAYPDMLEVGELDGLAFSSEVAFWGCAGCAVFFFSTRVKPALEGWPFLG